jgi:general secretion pathway protein K
MSRPARAAERGFILVAVLWMLAALATLASIYSVYIGDVAASTHLDDDRLRIRAATLAAIELTASKLSPMPEDSRSSSGAFNFTLDGASARASFIDEGARIDINAAKKEFLARLFTGLGAKSDDASRFADNIVAWRKGPGPGANTEAAAYQSAGVGYAPRQAPFENLLELRLVRDLPPPLVDRALPFLTLFSGRSEVNIRVADPIVLSALPNVTPDAVQNVLARRSKGGIDNDALVKLLGGGASDAVAKSGASYRVNVAVRLENGATGNAEVVILVPGPEDEEPYYVLAWRDASDGPL